MINYLLRTLDDTPQLKESLIQPKFVVLDLGQVQQVHHEVLHHPSVELQC